MNKSRGQGGAIPNLGSAWDSIVKQQIEMSFDKISNEAQSVFNTIVLP